MMKVKVGKIKNILIKTIMTKTKIRKNGKKSLKIKLRMFKINKKLFQM